MVLDHADLQDNPKKWWDEKRIQEIVAPYIKKWDADLVKNPHRTLIQGSTRPNIDS